MATYTLTIETDNPDLPEKIMDAFDQIGLDVDNDDVYYDLSATLLLDGAVVWGTEYDGAENNAGLAGETYGGGS